MLRKLLHASVRIRPILTTILITVGINSYEFLKFLWPIIFIIVSSIIIVILFLYLKTKRTDNKLLYNVLYYSFTFVIMAFLCCSYNLLMQNWKSKERYEQAEKAFSILAIASSEKPIFSLETCELAYNKGRLNPDMMTALGLYYLRNKMENKGKKILREAADKGEPVAQYYYGKLLRLGFDSEPDEITAFAYIKASAEQEFIMAQFDLINCYLYGKGTVGNMYEAEKWLYRNWELTAKEGLGLEVLTLMNLTNYYIISECYREAYKIGKRLITVQKKLNFPVIDYAAYAGICVAMNKYQEAFNYTKLGVDLEDAKCYILLGKFFDEGIGTKKNPIEAEKILLKAAQKFRSKKAFEELANLYKKHNFNNNYRFWNILVKIDFE